MLQKIDEDRLTEVLRRIQGHKMRFPVAQIEKATGFDKGMISKFINGKLPISDNFYSTFIATFEDVPSEQKSDFLTQRRGNKLKSAPFMVPFMPVKAQAGYTRASDQEVFVDMLEKYALPPGVNHQGAIWRYWEIEGDSMEPTFKSGDIILTSQVHQMDWEQLRNYYLYVLVTDDRVLFKRVFCKNPLEWVLISENEAGHDQQLLNVEYIKEVWVYRRSIVNKAPPIKMYEIKV
jgi:phage repressor protein C with HTH and peptisase S24 domain